MRLLRFKEKTYTYHIVWRTEICDFPWAASPHGGWALWLQPSSDQTRSRKGWAGAKLKLQSFTQELLPEGMTGALLTHTTKGFHGFPISSLCTRPLQSQCSTQSNHIDATRQQRVPRKTSHPGRMTTLNVVDRRKFLSTPFTQRQHVNQSVKASPSLHQERQH